MLHSREYQRALVAAEMEGAIMRCVFCKSRSDDSASVEHIMPESFGNIEHVLPKTWVCDPCNNYLAREVEKPFLDSAYGKISRFEMAVPNKRGRIPPITGIHAQSGKMVEVYLSPEDRSLCMGAAKAHDESKFINSLNSSSHGTLYLPMVEIPPSDFTTARFIGKVGLEVLTESCIKVPGWNDEIVDKLELDELRRYVRIGGAKDVWPVHIRRIYPAEHVFTDASNVPHQVLHEWKILHVPKSELCGEYYAVIAIFGIEYTMNLGGPELGGFYFWLKNHNNESPLYPNEALQDSVRRPSARPL